MCLCRVYVFVMCVCVGGMWRGCYGCLIKSMIRQGVDTFMYLCVCVSVSVFVFVCVCVCVLLSASVCVSVCACVWGYGCWMDVHMFMHVCRLPGGQHFVCICLYVPVCVCACVCRCECLYECLYVSVYVCVSCYVSWYYIPR